MRDFTLWEKLHKLTTLVTVSPGMVQELLQQNQVGSLFPNVGSSQMFTAALFTKQKSRNNPSICNFTVNKMWYSYPYNGVLFSNKKD